MTEPVPEQSTPSAPLLLAPAPVRTPEYRFFTTDLLTNALLAEHLPFQGVRFSRSLVEEGTFEGYLQVSDPDIQALDPWAHTIPRRTALWVARDETLVWGGIIWARPPYSPREGQLHVSASTFESYFSHRVLRPERRIPKTLSTPAALSDR